MAESVVSFVAEKLYNLLIEEATFLYGVRDQVELMQMELRQMRAFLRDAESNPTKGAGETNIVREFREATYNAEDVVDAYILRKHRRRRRQGFMGFIKKYGCILLEWHNIGMQIERINASLQKISEMRSKYGIGDVSGGAQQTVSEVDRIVQERRALAIRRELNVMVGFDDEMDRNVATLLDQGKPRRCVISIVGMGGAGKSSLARRICNRADVTRSFDGKIALVTVSQNWNVRQIFEDIATKLLGFNKEELQKMGEEDLKDKVFTSLQGMKYLIVLDDIWKTDVWSLIVPHLPDEKNGSRVMITTRYTHVARFADPSMEPHQLRLLREDESWDLFNKIVFPSHDEDAEKVYTGEFKNLTEKILKNCGGLPLAIVLMGGLLSTRHKSPIAWDDAVKGISREEDHEGGQVFSKVLALSYRDLPHHLKPCFLYLSHFPEDFEIEADKLVRLWVAEGFVPDQSRYQSHCRTMEEIAEGWLEDLVSRCLVQAVEGSAHSGKLLTCRMHDVLRDLSIKEAEEANFFHTWQQPVGSSVCLPPATTRRLAVHEGTSDQKKNEYVFQEFCSPTLRTFVLIGLEFEQRMIRSLQFLMSSKLLRVLDLEGSNCRELPKAVGDHLVHLRYLGLRDCSQLESIPSSVGNLQNLLTFDVGWSRTLMGVPDSMWGIGTLRHVLINSMIEPRNISGLKLVNLQTLSYVRAGSWVESSLASLTSLRTLGIDGISEAHHRSLSDSLDRLVHLRDLSFWGDSLPKKALALPNHGRLQKLIVVGRLQELGDVPALYASDEMPPNLNELVLKNTGLRQDPLSLLEKLPYLKRLSLTNAYEGGEEAVCSAGGFPQLEELVLWFDQSLRRWTVEDGAMPRLRRLDITSCERLEMLPEGLQHLKTLQTLEIEDMPGEFVRRLRKDEKDEGGEDWPKIQHVPHVKITLT